MSALALLRLFSLIQTITIILGAVLLGVILVSYNGSFYRTPSWLLIVCGILHLISGLMACSQVHMMSYYWIFAIISITMGYFFTAFGIRNLNLPDIDLSFNKPCTASEFGKGNKSRKSKEEVATDTDKEYDMSDYFVDEPTDDDTIQPDESID